MSVFYVPPPPSAPGRELGLIFCWACATGSQCPYPIYIIVYSVVAVSRPCRLLEFYLNRVTARPKGRAIKLTENSSIMFKLFSLHCMQSSWLKFENLCGVSQCESSKAVSSNLGWHSHKLLSHTNKLPLLTDL